MYSGEKSQWSAANMGCNFAGYRKLNTISFPSLYVLRRLLVYIFRDRVYIYPFSSW